jgi:hypothetical protein
MTEATEKRLQEIERWARNFEDTDLDGYPEPKVIELTAEIRNLRKALDDIASDRCFALRELRYCTTARLIEICTSVKNTANKALGENHASDNGIGWKQPHTDNTDSTP